MASSVCTVQLHNEVKQTLAQLQAVRQEALHGVQILRPDPVPWATRPDWSAQAESGPQAGTHPNPQPGPQPETQLSTQPGLQPGRQRGLQPGVQAGLQPRNDDFRFKRSQMEPWSLSGATSARHITPAQGNNMGTGDLASGGQRLGGSSAGMEVPAEGGSDGISERSPYTLPVSAASAGLIPKRQGEHCITVSALYRHCISTLYLYTVLLVVCITYAWNSKCCLWFPRVSQLICGGAQPYVPLPLSPCPRCTDGIGHLM